MRERSLDKDNGIARLKSDDFVTAVVILSALEAKKNEDDPYTVMLCKLGINRKKMVTTSKDSVGEYRKNYLAMIRELYRLSFFPKPCDYKRNPRDVYQRLKNNANYSDHQKDTLRFIISSDYLSATEKFAKTLENELFQDFLYIQDESTSLQMDIPYSKSMI